MKLAGLVQFQRGLVKVGGEKRMWFEILAGVAIFAAAGLIYLAWKNDKEYNKAKRSNE